MFRNPLTHFLVLITFLMGCQSPQKAVLEQNSVQTKTTDPKNDFLVTPNGVADTVQFLSLTDESPAKTMIDSSALVNVKTRYAEALRQLYIEQNYTAAKVSFQNTVMALSVWGDSLARAEEDFLDIDMDESAKSDDTKIEVSANDYPNWLAGNIIDHYKNFLEIKNEFSETDFNQNVLSKLTYFGLGIRGQNSTGAIKASITKGHSLDYIPTNVDNERVQKYIAYLTRDSGANIKYLYKKFGRDEKIMRDILKEEGLSSDLLFLALIESGYDANARSRANAMGHWQFIKKTATGYGMNVDWWVDDRRDVYVSTRLAARYLKEMFAEFGDWYLTLAAYNAGNGRIYNAMKKNNTRDYWEMTKLPRETKNYVPIFLAAAQIVKDPGKFGITLTKDPSFQVDTVTIRECLDIEAIAGCVGTTMDSIREINPSLLRWCTPPTVSSYLLKVPFGTRAKFVENAAKIPQEKKRSWIRYQVKYGETLSAIANRYGTDVKAIQQANQLKNAVNLATGQWILIPVAPKSYVAKVETLPKITPTNKNVSSNGNGGNNTVATKNKAFEGKKKLSFKVEAGNTLGDIAEWFNITSQNIRDWNGLYYGDPILVGQVLTIWVDQYIPDEGYRNATQKRTKEVLVEEPGTKIYIIQDNDNLTTVAKLFNVEVSSIKRWNKLTSNTLRVGDKLKIYLNK